MFAAAHPLLASSDTYIGPPGGDWNTASYWSPSGVPQPGDNVLFAPASGSYTYDGNYSTASPLDSFSFGVPGGASGPTMAQAANTLAATDEYFDTGTYTQSGGTNNAQTIIVGNSHLDNANYVLEGGSLTASVIYIDIGTGNATLSQTGNSYITSQELYIGSLAGAGTAVLSDGTLTAGGIEVASTGSISLGNGPTGALFQSGTSYIALGPGSLAIGNGTGSSGNASLSGGTLDTSGVADVGVNGGAGTLLQNGTSNINLDSLFVGNGAGSSGTASFAGGTLSAPGQVMYVGFLGGSGTLLQSGTSFVNLGGGQLYIGLTGSGTANLSGGTLNMTGGELIVGTAAGAGTLLQSGSSNINLNSGTLVVGYAVGSSGTVSVSGGTLTAGEVDVGVNGTASVTQTAGAVAVTGLLLLGTTTGAAGTYSLGGSGSLSATDEEYVGEFGTGTFIQAGGINSTGLLFVGFENGSTGAYSLSGGTIDIGEGYSDSYESIGEYGAGTFVQTGGTNNPSELTVGWRGSGTYYLESGTLIVTGSTIYPFEVIGSQGSGVGTFIQSGGIHTITAAATNGLELGNGSQASGSYFLTAGTLDVNVPELIGVYGSGTFNQSGGINQINGTLTLAAFAGASGIYNLQAGTLTAIATNIGPGGGGGTFMQSGSLSASSLGTLTVNASALTLSGGTMNASSINSSGTANLSGGTMNVTGTFNVGASGGAGTLLQSGTSNLLIGGSLNVGNGTASTGYASFSGGSFTDSYYFQVGLFGGTGTMLQGGTSSIYTIGINIGAGTGGVGTLILSGGTFQSYDSSVIGDSGGSGTLIQSANSYINMGVGTGYIIIGGFDGQGVASLSGGTINFQGGAFYMGERGNGTLLQSGSSFINMSSGGTIVIGGCSNTDPLPSVGTALLSGGTIYAPGARLIVGYNVNNAGTLIQSGSSDINLGSGTLNIGLYSTSTGYASLTGGTLTTGSVYVGDGTAVGTLSQSGTQVSTTAGSLNVSSTGTVLLSGGTIDARTINSAGNLTITGGTLAITGSGSLGSGSIAASGLSISGPGVLDVGSSGLVIEYGNGPSPVGDLSFSRTARNYPAGSIQRYAQTAIDNLNWDGPGISSSYAENDPNGLTAVGIADENDLNIYPTDYTVADGGSGTWMGQPINDTNNVLVRMTYYGDGNDDGVVNRFDVTALAQGYSGLAGYVGWSDGDYNYDGQINKNDVSLLAASYVFQGAPLGDAITPGQAQYMLALDPDMPANVQAEFDAIADGQTPEPAQVGLLAFTSLLFARRRRC